MLARLFSERSLDFLYLRESDNCPPYSAVTGRYGKPVSIIKRSCCHNLLRLLIKALATTSEVMQMCKTPLHPTSDYALHALNVNHHSLLLIFHVHLLAEPGAAHCILEQLQDIFSMYTRLIFTRAWAFLRLNEGYSGD